MYLQEGRTPLHYASALKGTTSGVNQLYDILVDNGADENVVDVVSYSNTVTEISQCHIAPETFKM